MKKIFILFLITVSSFACVDKKEENKKTDHAIQQIDSIQMDVEKDIEDLEKSTKEVEETLKELDNI